MPYEQQVLKIGGEDINRGGQLNFAHREILTRRLIRSVIRVWVFFRQPGSRRVGLIALEWGWPLGWLGVV